MPSRPPLSPPDVTAASDWTPIPDARPVDAALTLGDARMPVLDLHPRGFALRTPGSVADGLMHVRFTIGSCLHLVVPAYVVHSWPVARRAGADFITEFEFAFDQGHDDLDQVVALLLETAKTGRTVH